MRTRFQRPDQRIEYDEISATLAYRGRAAVGSVTSEPVWQIARLTYGSTDDDVSVEWAGTTDGYVHIWDNRESLSYG